MTLSQLAKLANVSVSTASKAFSMSREVNKETREHIFSVARKHGCFKNFFNAKYHKYVIAIICPEISSKHYTDLCFSLQKQFNKQNCEVCISTTDFYKNIVEDRLIYYDNYSSVDGIILVDSNIKNLPFHQTPVICIGGNNKNANKTIRSDLKPAIKSAIIHLKNNGINNIGFIGEELTTPKLELFKTVLTEENLQFNTELTVTVKNRFEKGGFEAAKTLYKKSPLPEALFCAYDDMAFGAMHFFKTVGIKLPQDLKIIGMDNISTSAYFNPSLSTIDSMSEKIAALAVNDMLDILNGKNIEQYQKTNSKFIMRDSTQF